MDSLLLDTPDGISARLGWDPKVSVHDRRRILARELVAAKLGVGLAEVRIDREAPKHFGYHTRLIAAQEGVDLPILITTASYRAATVVAISDPGIAVGLDIRDLQPDDASVHEMRRRSHLLAETDVPGLLAHWTRVQAVLEADSRGVRVHPEYVRLDSSLTKGWLPDRNVFYQIDDISRGGWIITLAHAEVPIEEPIPIPAELLPEDG